MKPLDDMSRAERQQLWLRMAHTHQVAKARRLRDQARMYAQLFEIWCLPCTTDSKEDAL